MCLANVGNIMIIGETRRSKPQLVRNYSEGIIEVKVPETRSDDPKYSDADRRACGRIYCERIN